MRTFAIAIAALLLCLSAQTQAADTPETCKTMHSVPDHLACHERVLTDMINKMTIMSQQIMATDQNAIKNRDHVQIQSNVFNDKCLDQRSNPNPTPNADEVRMVTCQPTDPADKWTLIK